MSKDWTPSPEYVAKIIREHGVDPRESLRAFQNHWLSKSGAGATKVDWERTFDNWVMEDHHRGKLSPCPFWKADEVLGQMSLVGSLAPVERPEVATPQLTAEERAAAAKRLAEVFGDDDLAKLGSGDSE